METFRSLKHICYGFAALTHDKCVKDGHSFSLSRINQDAAEHHFGHCRQQGGSTDTLMEGEWESCTNISGISRLSYAQNRNCSSKQNRTTVTVTEQKKLSLSKKRRRGNRK